MAAGQSNRLWTVKLKDLKPGKFGPRELGFSSLFILASDSEVASRKARRWMKKNNVASFMVEDVNYEGEIDSF